MHGSAMTYVMVDSLLKVLTLAAAHNTHAPGLLRRVTPACAQVLGRAEGAGGPLCMRDPRLCGALGLSVLGPPSGDERRQRGDHQKRGPRELPRRRGRCRRGPSGGFLISAPPRYLDLALEV